MKQQVETTLNQQKRSGASQSSVTITALGQTLIPYSEDRTSLIVCSHPTATPVLSLQTGAAATQGITIPPLGLPLIMDLQTHGSIIKGPIYVVGGAVPTTYTYLEALNKAP